MAQTNKPAPRVTVIGPRQQEKAKLRVAAYARVGNSSEANRIAYIAQVDYYSRLIASNEAWELVDIYADEGISGHEARNRSGFNRLMDDCRAGKIDRILCKSISRFTRNIEDYIQYVRELMQLGVSVCFEKENIDTSKITSEQIAQIHRVLAQIESISHSSNMWYDGLTARFDQTKARLDEVSHAITERQAQREKIEMFLADLGKRDGPLTAFDEDAWYSLVDYVTVYSKDDIRFTFKNGMKIRV